ncbi:Methionine import ATP-binding protein MetN [Rhodoplanes serenus]|uniref:Cell division ATP-binding protein FtsE n=2 Tax=Nitrobacteraceae TaxID=41294 RepID=A0A447CY50_9BRAD|nr:methionine ABC transporter ATP-binding protein [Rhodoplanes serenus]VCU10236.1 Methionine import ATP-binding protein MetN [Rhodoplanes serenus]
MAISTVSPRSISAAAATTTARPATFSLMDALVGRVGDLAADLRSRVTPTGSAAQHAAAAAMDVPAVRFEAVSRIFPARKSDPAVAALDHVSLDVAPGSIYGIIGRSGAGKSTLVRLVNGLDRPTQGRVLIDGVDLAGLDAPGLRALRRRIGMIFQHFNLLSSRTAAANVALPLELAGVPAETIRTRVAELLDLVGLADKANRYPAELSGGQKQRVGIARALATEPKVLLSDEATSALDPETTEQILALLKRVNALTGVTIVLITHEMRVITSICDRVAVLEGGRVVEEGAVYGVFAHPRAETTRRLVAAVNGTALPPELSARLRADPAGASLTVLRIVFTGDEATEPILSRLSRSLDIEVNILAGRIDEIGGAPFGTLVVGVPSRPDLVAAVTELVRSNGLGVEVLGHVA